MLHRNGFVAHIDQITATDPLLYLGDTCIRELERARDPERVKMSMERCRRHHSARTRARKDQLTTLHLTAAASLRIRKLDSVPEVPYEDYTLASWLGDASDHRPLHSLLAKLLPERGLVGRRN